MLDVVEDHQPKAILRDVAPLKVTSGSALTISCSSSTPSTSRFARMSSAFPGLSGPTCGFRSKNQSQGMAFRSMPQELGLHVQEPGGFVAPKRRKRAQRELSEAPFSSRRVAGRRMKSFVTSHHGYCNALWNSQNSAQRFLP